MSAKRPYRQSGRCPITAHLRTRADDLPRLAVPYVAVVHHARVASAPDQYKRMLRQEIAPALRDLGMEGSASNFVLPDPDHYLLVGIQGSRSNTAGVVRFTVNLAVISKAKWKQGWRAWWGRPSATAQGPVGTYMRLGELTPQHDDVWWELTPDADTATLAAEVVQAVQQFGLVWLLEARSDG
jgi:hypothetical protein